ncbi:MAG: hypothetical protein ACI9EW_002584 [Cellvibrionaceae bacterium]|jgi:hypothetical protein
MMQVKKFKSKNSGQALVEFALILIVLLLLITFVIEIGRITWAWAAVQTSARTGARYAITGSSEPDICGDPIVEGCLARTESVHAVALQGLTGWRIREDVTFQDDNFTLVQIFGFNSSLPAGQQLQEGYAGEPGQPVVVRVTYNVPIITPLLRPIVENVPVFGQVTLTNELFGGQGGQTEGVSLPPPLPSLPKLGPTDTPTPTPTETEVPTVDPDATATTIPSPTLVVECDVKIQGQLIEGNRILTITGDRYVDNDSNNNVYTVEIRSIGINSEIIASGVPFGAIGNDPSDHGCANGNEGLIQLDLAITSPDYYINPAYAAGLPANIIVVVLHENGSEDDEAVISSGNATATVLAPTATLLPTFTPTPTPIVAPTLPSPGVFISFFPDGGSCVSRDPATNTIRFTIGGGNWVAGHTIKFTWDNVTTLPITVIADGDGNIAPELFDLGNIGAGAHTLTAIDSVSGDSYAKNITIPCPMPVPTETPTPTPTLSPPDLIISAPKIQASSLITTYTSVDFSFAITNTGGTDINSLFFVDLFLDPPPAAFGSETSPITRTYIIADPYSDGYIAVPDMLANSSRVITITSAGGFENLPGNPPRIAWGMVDSINHIPAEEHEDNNLSSAGGIVVTQSAFTPTPTSTPSPEEDPFSIQGIVLAYYTQFVPQLRAIVYLVEQPVSGQGKIVAQANSDSNGRYRFDDVPALTGGDSYTIVACLPLAGSDAFAGSWGSVLPDATDTVIVDIYMVVSPIGCSF